MHIHFVHVYNYAYNVFNLKNKFFIIALHTFTIKKLDVKLFIENNYIMSCYCHSNILQYL